MRSLNAAAGIVNLDRLIFRDVTFRGLYLRQIPRCSVGFHSVPIYPSEEYVQPLDSVGTSELRGDTSGCIRALPEDAVLIWDHLDFGATVKVIS